MSTPLFSISISPLYWYHAALVDIIFQIRRAFAIFIDYAIDCHAISPFIADAIDITYAIWCCFIDFHFHCFLLLILLLSLIISAPPLRHYWLLPLRHYALLFAITPLFHFFSLMPLFHYAMLITFLLFFSSSVHLIDVTLLLISISLLIDAYWDHFWCLISLIIYAISFDFADFCRFFHFFDVAAPLAAADDIIWFIYYYIDYASYYFLMLLIFRFHFIYAAAILILRWYYAIIFAAADATPLFHFVFITLIALYWFHFHWLFHFDFILAAAAALFCLHIIVYLITPLRHYAAAIDFSLMPCRHWFFAFSRLFRLLMLSLIFSLPLPWCHLFSLMLSIMPRHAFIDADCWCRFSMLMLLPWFSRWCHWYHWCWCFHFIFHYFH